MKKKETFNGGSSFDCDTETVDHQSLRPKFSIVFTTYNAQEFICSAVTAALAQDYTNFEIIVVDDGSTDDTVNICRNINHSNFTFYDVGRVGRSKALNFAISKATGDFIAINDVDDLSLPDRLSSVANFIQTHPSVVLLGTGYIATKYFYATIPEEYRNRHVEHDAPIWITEEKLYRNNPFVHSTVVFKKSLWRSISGYDEDIDICVDYDFFLRAYSHGVMVFLPYKTVFHLINATSFFKKKSKNEYLKTLIYIKRRVRGNFKLSLFSKLYDLVPYYLYVRTSLLAILRQSFLICFQKT